MPEDRVNSTELSGYEWRRPGAGLLERQSEELLKFVCGGQDNGSPKMFVS